MFFILFVFFFHLIRIITFPTSVLAILLCNVYQLLKCIRMQLYCRFLVFPRAGGTWKSCWHMLIEGWELCRLPSNTSVLLTQQPFVPLCRPVLHLSHFRFSHICKSGSFLFSYFIILTLSVRIYDVLLSRYLTNFTVFFLRSSLLDCCQKNSSS